MKFLAKYWHFGPIWPHGRPKKNANKVPSLGGLPLPNLNKYKKTNKYKKKTICFLPLKLRILSQNMHLWSFCAKYWHFCPFCPKPDQKTVRKRCIGVFLAQTGQIWPKICFLGHIKALLVHLVPC